MLYMRIARLQPLPFDLNVSTPARDLVVNTACLHCLVVIQNRDFLLAFFHEPGVARYLSANGLVVTMRNGETEFVSLASVEVSSNIHVEGERVIQPRKVSCMLTIGGVRGV
ncbi:hypothetical protein A2U01_0035489 [Trifolium medium]|uniref:Uncharacterized protein n=1 Tax=Trifolium medium TaxID=97028 RepID=A0A392PQJ2_9FABA|nr:hypothetical protein [Trifolium medium]